MAKAPKFARILVVAEKPNQGREIASALLARCYDRREMPQGGVMGRSGNRELIVAWANGHLREMKKPEEIMPEWGSPWRLEVLPMVPANCEIPQKTRPGAGATLTTLAGWMHEATEIVNACDAEREGELIFDEICRYAGLSQADPPKGLTFSRMWISDTRPEALVSAFVDRDRATLMRLINAREAAWAHAEADWLWGMNMSRYATKTLERPELPVISIGRVQTPLLGEISERDKTIATFVPEPFDFVPMTFRGETGAIYEARLVAFPEIRHRNVDHHFVPGPELREIRQELLSTMPTAWKVTDLEEPREELAPPPFSLPDLQRSAFRLFGWSAHKTLDVAQVLYDREKAISYPRTESYQVPKGMRDQVLDVRDKLYYAWALDRFPELKNAVLPTDEAHWADSCGEHYAILPTGVVPQAWGSNDVLRDEYKLWQLIAVRTILAWLPTAKIDAVKRLMMRPWGKDTVIRAYVEAEPVEDPGWLWYEDKMMNTRGIGKPLEERMREVALPKAGGVAALLNLTIKTGFTSAPKHYDDDTVIGWMQREGLGTASTRHVILEELIDRGYLVRTESGVIRASAAGMMLVGMLTERVGDELTGVPPARLVEEMVERIGGMAKERPTRVLMWGVVLGRIRNVSAKFVDSKGDPDEAYCPRTGVRAEKHSSGKYWMFAGYPDAKCWLTMSGRPVTANEYAGILGSGDRGYLLHGFTSTSTGNQYDAHVAWKPRKKKFEKLFKRR